VAIGPPGRIALSVLICSGRRIHALILSDQALHELLPHLIRNPKYEFINPASVDIRVGSQLVEEVAPYGSTEAKWKISDLTYTKETTPYKLEPGRFVLAATYEYIMVPNGYAVELRLKSSRAREGYNHSLAFWVDPGWQGILTMEIQNITRWHTLPLWYGMRFAQLIVHKLDSPAVFPYDGKYQDAQGPEGAKSS
jgi:dCTP deaminase